MQAFEYTLGNQTRLVYRVEAETAMAEDVWTVQDAKAQLSELLRRAKAGKPQRIGMTDEACVVVSAKAWEALHPSALGSWLVENAPVGEDLELPARRSHRAAPFATDRDRA